MRKLVRTLAGCLPMAVLSVGVALGGYFQSQAQVYGIDKAVAIQKQMAQEFQQELNKALREKEGPRQ